MRAELRWAGGFVIVLAAGLARAGDLDDAAGLRKSGKLDDAVAKYKAAAAADPAAEAPALGLSETLLALKRYDDAAAAVDSALKAHEASTALILAKVRALVDGADAALNRRSVDVAVRPEVVAKTTEARKWVDRLLAADPKSVPARVLDARIARHEQGEETADVRARFEKAVADAPADADANFHLAMLLFRAAGRNNRDKSLWASGEKCFRAAHAADPANGQALLNAAFCSAWQARYDTYVKDLERAAELMAGDDAPLAAITKHYSKNPERRVPIFTRLQEKLPGDPGVVLHLAFALNDVGKDEQGRKLLEDLCAASPKSASPAYQLASFHLAGGKKAEAVEAAVRAAGLCTSPADRPVYDQIDRMTVRTTQFTPEQRDRIWSALLAAFPDDVNGPNNAGIWFRDVAKNPVKGLEWFLKALKVAPEDVMLLNDVAVAYQTLPEPDLDKAEEYFHKAIATAKKSGIDRPDRSKGYTLAVDNLVKLLAADKRVKDLVALATEIAGDPRGDSIRQLAESLRR